MQLETTMSTLTTSFLLAFCTVAVWVAQPHAQNAETNVVRLPQDIVYKGLPGAPQHVTLFGDSSQPGLYVDRIKFQPGMKVMPHWHPDTVRTVLVMSGTFYFAVGVQWDESKLKAYPAGTLDSEHAKTPHYAWAKDGEVILQVSAWSAFSPKAADISDRSLGAKSRLLHGCKHIRSGRDVRFIARPPQS